MAMKLQLLNVVFPNSPLSSLPLAMPQFLLSFLSHLFFFQSSDSYSVSLALANNDVLFVHRYIRLTGYVGRAVLFGHTLVGYIPNDSLPVRKSVPAKSGDNKRIGRERHTLHPAIADDIADRRIFCKQRGNGTDATLQVDIECLHLARPFFIDSADLCDCRINGRIRQPPLSIGLPPIDIRSTFRESWVPIQSADSRENCP